MKKLIALATMTALLASSARSENLTGMDKQMHFVGSAGMAGLASLVLNKPADRLTPMLLALSIGLAKEISDKYRKGGSGFSRNDLLVDAIGAYMGTVTGAGTVLLVSGNRKSISLNIFKVF